MRSPNLSVRGPNCRVCRKDPSDSGPLATSIERRCILSASMRMSKISSAMADDGFCYKNAKKRWRGISTVQRATDSAAASVVWLYRFSAAWAKMFCWSGAHMVAHFSELVPKTKVTELNGIGHYPQVQAPREVLAAYLSFRDEVDARLAATSGRLNGA
jgi:hypothetical protein